MNPNFVTGNPLPESIGACADLYSEVRALRLAMDKEVKEVKARETEIQNYIIDNLSKSDDTGAAGLRYRAQIKTKEVPTVEDWPSFYAHIQETGSFDLLGKSLGKKAVEERLAAGDAVPGVGTFQSVSVSITKLS